MTISRRQFIVGASIVPVQPWLASRVVASDLPELDVADPTATALGYVAESATDGQTCANCQLYTGEDGADLGPCAIFPGKGVRAGGWCKSWVVKQVNCTACQAFGPGNMPVNLF